MTLSMQQVNPATVVKIEIKLGWYAFDITFVYIQYQKWDR